MANSVSVSAPGKQTREVPFAPGNTVAELLQAADAKLGSQQTVLLDGKPVTPETPVQQPGRLTVTDKRKNG